MSGKRRVRVGGRGGALLCLAVFLGGSGVLRFSDGAGAAIARELAAVQDGAAGAPACTADEDIAMILAALDERERKLDEREAAIEARLATLAEAEAEIELNMARLVEAEAELAQTMAQADEAAEADLGRLTAVYESMKPKDAALLFSQMDVGFAAGFLGRMRPEAAAEIMAGLPPEVAYSVSVVLAGRNANAPTE